ncbi:MAG: single-stranded-DNA-specific exonuclease RecJ, partial [Proteobacteria bacterium]|nr:single-stranded-DNA-specific exonuclease RecJ [Pseudomonadota bacterium]
MSKRWNVTPASAKLRALFVNELNILPLTAQLLINRGIDELEDAQNFLRPDITKLHDPMLMKDMDKAVERLERAIAEGEKVAVCGDYDVDGTTATALLKLFLTELGLTVLTHIPERISEGYGLNNNALKKLSEQGVKVVITTDCGVSNYDETKYANSIGLDVIITDHHEVPENIPQALAIVNPRQVGCAFPFKGLAGVGVAFNLAMALRAHLKKTGHINEATQPNLKKYLDFVSIGTVADMVPLVDENRIFVKYGIEQLNNTERPGIKALIDVSLIRDGLVTSEKISYQIAPRINAAGRVSRADIALDLLTTTDKARATELASQLDNINSERRFLEADITEEALAMIDPDSTDKGIVLYSENWHPGVIGIVASKISGRFTKPT